MKVEIYGASWCVVCKNAVELCKNNNIDYEYIDVDITTNLRSLEERLGAQVRSVPQIFVDSQHIPEGMRELNRRIN